MEGGWGCCRSSPRTHKTWKRLRGEKLTMKRILPLASARKACLYRCLSRHVDSSRWNRCCPGPGSSKLIEVLVLVPLSSHPLPHSLFSADPDGSFPFRIVQSRTMSTQTRRRMQDREERGQRALLSSFSPIFLSLFLPYRMIKRVKGKERLSLSIHPSLDIYMYTCNNIKRSCKFVFQSGIKRTAREVIPWDDCIQIGFQVFAYTQELVGWFVRRRRPLLLPGTSGKRISKKINQHSWVPG